MSFDGGIRLDGTLDLDGTVNLTPQTINKLTLGKVTPTESIPVTLKVTGPAWKPEVQGLELKPAVAAIAKQAAAGLAGKVLGEKGKQVQQVITGGQQAAQAEAEKKKQELEAKAAAEKARVEAAAKAEQEKAKKKAEDEAKKRLRGIFGK
jgi:AsmA protein